MEEVIVYGFGSFFNPKKEFQDIDILILHRSTSYESCQFSLLCKKHILSNIHNADITILSDSEERQLKFLEKSDAKYFGKAHEITVKNDLDAIYTKIRQYREL